MALAAPLLIPIAILLTILLYLALQKATDAWLKPLLQWIFAPRQAFWKRVLLWPVQEIGKGLVGVIHWVKVHLGAAFYLAASKVGRWLHALAWVTELPDLAFERLAKTTLDAFTYIRNVAIPQLVDAAVRPVRQTANTAKAEADAALSTLTGISTEVAAGLRSLPWGVPGGITNRFAAFFNAFEHIWDQVFKHIIPRLDLIQYTTLPRIAGDVADIFDDLYKTGRNSLPNIRRRLANLEGDFAGIFSNPLAWLEALLLGTAGLAMLARVLAKVAPELFCRNTTKAARALCAADPTAFDGLLELLVAGAILANFHDYVRLMQGVTAETTSGIKTILEVA